MCVDTFNFLFLHAIYRLAEKTWSTREKISMEKKSVFEN